MIPKLSQIEPVPGTILLLPYQKEAINRKANIYVPAEEQDNSVGLVVGYTPKFPPMPDTYDPGDGRTGHAPPKRQLKVGDVIVYRRVSSQAIALEKEDGEVQNYRFITEDDFAFYVNP